MISVMTVNYKTADYLERMLETLFAHHRHGGLEIFVVENGSGDDLTSLETRFPHVTFLYSPINRGFAGGCNMALRLATGNVCVLVNPDIRFVSDALYQVEQAMNTHPLVGIGGIRLLQEDGSQQSCVWRFPHIKDQLLVLSKIPHLISCQAIDAWTMKDFDYTQDADVDQVMGAFFCMRREVLQDIGLLDDGFFLWYEEVDFAKRAKDAGWPSHYFHHIQAIHKGGSSFDRVATFKKQSFMRRSLCRYMRKHYGKGVGALFTLLEPLWIILACLASLIKPR